MFLSISLSLHLSVHASVFPSILMLCLSNLRLRLSLLRSSFLCDYPYVNSVSVISLSPSLCLSLCLAACSCVFVSFRWFIYLTTSLSGYSCIFLVVCPGVYLSTSLCQFISLSFCLPLSLSVHISLLLSTYLSTYISLLLSTSLCQLISLSCLPISVNSHLLLCQCQSLHKSFITTYLYMLAILFFVSPHDILCCYVCASVQLVSVSFCIRISVSMYV